MPDSNRRKFSTSSIKKHWSATRWDAIARNFEGNFDGEDIYGLKVGKVWYLANGVLKEELENKLYDLLENELPTYYTNYCNKLHENAMKERNK